MSRIDACVAALALLQPLAAQDVPMDASGARTTADWKRIEPPLALDFPADHGAHPEFQTEWWYLTGHLEDERGERYGFQFTVFRRGLEAPAASAGGATASEDESVAAAQARESPLRAREAYAGHLVLTEVARGETRFAERLRRSSPLARAELGRLDVRLEDWSLVRTEAGELELSAADPARAFGLALTLVPEKPLVLHGEGGYSQKGGASGNASAYVSWTRLALRGTLQRDGAEHAVTGSAWFDHEFGSSVLAEGAVGWDWFGLQLDDGRELMLFVLRDRGGAPLQASAATWVERDGSTRALRRGDFALRATEAWKSPRTGASYPAGWTIAIPSLSLDLELVPLVADCELVGERSTGVSYWEGPVDVRGSARGRGYAELTGYADSLSGRF